MFKKTFALLGVSLLFLICFKLSIHALPTKVDAPASVSTMVLAKPTANVPPTLCFTPT